MHFYTPFQVPPPSEVTHGATRPLRPPRYATGSDLKPRKFVHLVADAFFNSRLQNINRRAIYAPPRSLQTLLLTIPCRHLTTQLLPLLRY